MTERTRASLGAPPQSQALQSEDYDDFVSQSDDSRNGSVAGSSVHTQGSEASFSGKAALLEGSYDFHNKWTVTNEPLFDSDETDSDETDSEDFDYSPILRRIAARGIYSTYASDFMDPGNDVTTSDDDVTTREDGMSRLYTAETQHRFSSDGHRFE
ncbi:hypothetical protein ACHAPN_002551 [Verticillium nonalfalfae]